MNKKEILVELIDHLFEFDAKNQDETAYSTKDFVAYLNTRLASEKTEMRKIEGDKEVWLQDARVHQHTDISILITLMYRYAKNYIKKALQDSIIQTADEFSFLITLMTFESLTKTELINKQVMEKTSGVEVIKRLLNQKLITEFDDQNDKRSVRVAITLEGKKEIEKVLPRMSLVSTIVVGNLVDSEITTLSYLLKKLDHHHNDIFMNRRNLSLEELKSKE